METCGELTIKRGLKRRAAQTKAGIDREMKESLERLLCESRCDYVFTSQRDPATPLAPWVLETQMTRVRKKISTHPDAACMRCVTPS